MIDMGLINFSIWQVVKIFIIVFLGLYIIFSAVVVRQVQLMVATIKVGFENQLKFLGLIHLLFSIAVLIFAIIIL